jgi:undecaprenyl-diphosphatase
VEHLTHYLQIILLGIVEGVTEFLPISSTGHLLIAEHFLGGQQSDIFNVVIQAGAILAVLFIYWHKIMVLLGNLQNREARSYLVKIFASFVITSLVYLMAAKLMGHHKLTESLANVAWATLIGGLFIFAVELFARNLYPHEDISWFEAVLVGCAQVVAAIFPGTSRSGASIMSILAVGVKRPTATEFSFLVGIPTMFAASIYALVKDRKDIHGIGDQLLIDTALGFVVSGIVAFFVVKWLLRFVQSHTFNGFAIYRVLLGGGLLLALYTQAIPDIGGEPQTVSVPRASPSIIAPPAPMPSGTAATLSTPAPATTDSTMTNAAPAQPAYLRAQPVNPSDLTNDTPATNAAILPPPATPAPAPETSAPATNNVPAPQN